MAAVAPNTLAGLVQFNRMDIDDINPVDLLQDAPLLQVLFAKGASNGTNHNHLVQTVASSAAFRAVNAGLTKTYSQDDIVTIALKVLDGSFDFDKALLLGQARGDVFNRELKRTMKSVFFEMEKQILYGVGNDAGGFAGLSDNTYLASLAQATVTEPSTPGTTVAEQSSVFLIRSGDEDIAAIMGNDGNIEVGDPFEFQKVVNPGTDNKTYTAQGASVLGWAAMQYGGKYSAGRIANVETVLADADIYANLSTFPASRQPTHIVMNRPSAKLLRASRTATNATGAPAPFPTEVEGIPIVITDAVNQVEAIET